LGDAAAALALLNHAQGVPAALRSRLDRPTPRVIAGQALAAVAHACVDVSDGLLADLGHICAASGVGATIAVDDLPASEALRVLDGDGEQRRRWQASGGDDYELCFTAPLAQRDAV